MKTLPLVLLLLGLSACHNKNKEHSSEHHDSEGTHSEEGSSHEHSVEHGGDKHGGDEHGHHEEGLVSVPAAALESGTIVLGRSKSGHLDGAIELPAEIQLPPDHVAHVSPLVDGQLLNVKAGIGDVIKKGQALATLRSIALGHARAEVSRSAAALKVAKQNLQRQETLRSEGISSERSFLEAQGTFEQAQASLNAAYSELSVFGATSGSGPDMTLTSPIAGILIERHATQGENVSPGDPLFVIADTSQVWVIGRSYERQLASLVPDMTATLTLPAYPHRTWEGKVEHIDATLDPATRTLPVRVAIKNEEGLLRPGLFGSLLLSPQAAGKDGVLIPLSAIQQVEGKSVVFLPTEEKGSFMKQAVTLGRESGSQVEVIKGIAADQELVTEGAFILKSELMRSELAHEH